MTLYRYKRVKSNQIGGQKEMNIYIYIYIDASKKTESQVDMERDKMMTCFKTTL